MGGSADVKHEQHLAPPRLFLLGSLESRWLLDELHYYKPPTTSVKRPSTTHQPLILFHPFSPFFISLPSLPSSLPLFPSSLPLSLFLSGISILVLSLPSERSGYSLNSTQTRPLSPLMDSSPC